MFLFTGHDGMVTCLWHCLADPKESGSKSILVSGSKDDFLKVWDLDPEDVNSPLITTLEGHSSWISEVTGTKMKMIFSASNDKSAKMWVYTMETVCVLTNPDVFVSTFMCQHVWEKVIMNGFSSILFRLFKAFLYLNIAVLKLYDGDP